MNGAWRSGILGAALLLAGCKLPEAEPREGPLVRNLFFGETADPVGPGTVRLSGFPDYADFGNAALKSLLGAVEIGVTEELVLRSAVPYLLLEDENGEEIDGFGDVVVGGLFSLPGTENWRMAVTLDVGLGNAEPPFPVGKVLVRPGFVASGRISNVEFHAGLAGLFTEDDAEAEGFAAFVYATSILRGILEVSGVTQNGNIEFALLTPGVGLQTGPLEIILGEPIGLTSASRNWGVTGAISFTF